MIRWLVPALLLPAVAAGSALERGLQAKAAGDFPTATRVLAWQADYPQASAELAALAREQDSRDAKDADPQQAAFLRS